MAKRVEYIDIAKGIGILLMIMGHSYSSDNLFIHWLNSFHMPLFFIVSGILYGQRENLPLLNLKKKFITLLLPYLFWNFLYQMFLAVLAVIGGAQISGALGQRLYAYITLGGGAMWFLPVMFFAGILFVLCVKNRYFNIITAVLLMLITLFIPYRSTFTDILLRVFTGYSFITAGYYLCGLFTAEIPFPYLMIVFALNIVFALTNGNVGLSDLIFNHQGLYLANAFLGTYCVLQFSMKRIPEKIKNVLSLCGKNSVILLCTHGFVIQIIRLADYKLTNNTLTHAGIAEGVMITSITAALILILLPIINRWFAWSFGRESMNRRA